MAMVAVGKCDRCRKNVKSSPGLGYASKSGVFSFCNECLLETGIGDRARRKNGLTARRTVWLDDVLPESRQDKTDRDVMRFYLGHAEKDWCKLENVHCPGGCTPYHLKLYGRCGCHESNAH